MSLLLCLLAVAMAAVPGASAARLFFVFGDSLVDNGNNNYLATTARADAPPYGIDYPTHRATGRFSNGLNIPDIISEYLGSEATLPYLAPELQGEKLLVGANFASAGVGILNDTGIQFVSIIRIRDQLRLFREYQDKLAGLVGAGKAAQLLGESLVLITLGGNDFVNNYFLVPYSLRRNQFPSIPDYVDFLISEYSKILASLYELGARRVIVTGTGPIGCTPGELAQHSRNGECAEELMTASTLFNAQLVQLQEQLNKEIGGDVFVSANAHLASFNYISDPAAFGFVTAKYACCGQGPYNGIGLCTAQSVLCQNRSAYAFWDAFHPTERANRMIVDHIMHGSTEVMRPMNLSAVLAADALRAAAAAAAGAP